VNEPELLAAILHPSCTKLIIGYRNRGHCVGLSPVAISFLFLQGLGYSNEKRKDKRGAVDGTGNRKGTSKKSRGGRTRTKITHLFMPDSTKFYTIDC
jgi:hypothetical protein